MKLLHIEATNLNSLYGENSVDLDASLAGASLFLIYGPTGSGKSTLMDAVSLALFGVTPRLNRERNRADADPAEIMSRGTGDCSAAVIFSKSEDGGGSRSTYRARWSCWRARKKPDGAPQSPERSLERLEPGGDWRSEEGWTLLMASKKSKEFTPAFEDVLEGFGVGDFNRSMLLAQGQFDAFLGAPPEDRAGILERLTDTSIYKRLGERAASMQRRHADRLNALGVLAGAGGGLDALALEELQGEHARNAEALATAQEGHEGAKLRLSWFEEAVECRDRLSETEGSAEQLKKDADTAGETLERLAAHELCETEDAFVRLDAFGGVKRMLAELDERVDDLDRSLPDLEVAASTSERALVEAKQKEDLASQQLRELRPLGKAAEQASGADETAGKAEEEAKARREGAQAKWVEAESQLASATTAQERAREKSEAAESDLALHAADGTLAESWDSFRSQLDQLVSTAVGLADGVAKLAIRKGDLQTERTTFAKEGKAHQDNREATLKTPRDSLRLAEQSLNALLGGGESETIRQVAIAAVERDRLRLDRVSDALPPVRSAREKAAKLDQARAELTVESAELLTIRGQLEDVASTEEVKTEQESQAREALERTKEVAGLVGQRASLQSGEECPLCGSVEHPWSEDADRKKDDARIHEVVLEAEGASDAARCAREQATAAVRELEGKATLKQGELDLREEQVNRAQTEQVELDREASAILKPLQLPEDCKVDELDEAHGFARRELESAEIVLSELAGAQRSFDDAARELQDVTGALKEADDLLAARAIRLEERGQQIERDERVQQNASDADQLKRSACRVELKDQGLTTATDDPAVWLAEGDQRRDAHQARVAEITSLGAVLTLAKAQRGSDEARLHEARDQRDKLGGEAEEAESKHLLTTTASRQARVAFEEAWETLIAAGTTSPSGSLPAEDSPPPAFVAAQEVWVEALEVATVKTVAKRDDSKGELSTARTQRETWRSEQGKRKAERAEARVQLDAALVALGHDEDNALLAHRLGDDVLLAARETRKQLEQRRVGIETQLKERRDSVERHHATQPAGFSAEDLESEHHLRLEVEREEATTLLKEASAVHGETDGRLRAHAQALLDQKESRRKLEAAEKDARVWEQLHECIGVKNGGRFKEFAQALNLGQLLDKANVHLARLSERYRLIPRLEEGLPTLEFDVSDLWQVGVRVAPRSLSGGERFLVSLALALGLSDFRSVKMPIETLLLDEGFGTLDPDTLSVALAALSQLQADGRQVGIISHVVGLRERIEARVEVKQLGGGRSQVQASA